MALSYADLFRNFLLSRKMFDGYFSIENQKTVHDLFLKGNNREAYDFYINLTNDLPEREWLPKNFVVNQALYILQNFYFKEPPYATVRISG
jgi:hypothetical protein